MTKIRFKNEYGAPAWEESDGTTHKITKNFYAKYNGAKVLVVMIKTKGEREQGFTMPDGVKPVFIECSTLKQLNIINQFIDVSKIKLLIMGGKL